MSRTVFNHSGLVRALADLAVAETPDSKQSFADKLGQWLGFAEALSLYSALNPGTEQTSPLRTRVGTPAELRAAFERVRNALADSANATAPEPGDDFTPYHRHHLARQREMSAEIGLLRASVRTALARRSPALKRLAALDAVMEQALAARERNLLASVPQRLSKRFQHLNAAHLANADAPGQAPQPDGWLAAYCAEMRTVLLAELELRLRPVDGLIAALENDMTG
nr:DUF3348 family protein [Zoogloeaceae bacterium]